MTPTPHSLPLVSRPDQPAVHPTWEVRDYQTRALLHVADNYEAADDWRLLNHQRSVVIPHWRLTRV